MLQMVMSHQAGAEKQTPGLLEKQTVLLSTETYGQPPCNFLINLVIIILKFGKVSTGVSAVLKPLGFLCTYH